MHIQYIQNSNIEEFESALEHASQTAKSILILSCDENDYDAARITKTLVNCPVPILGGIFPQIIYKNQNYSIGTLIITLDESLDLTVVENLSSSSLEQLDEMIEEKLGILDNEIKTMFVFVDGLSKNINDIILTLFENFGLSINYIGGGTGSLMFEQKPSLFTNSGLIEDAAVLATSLRESAIGVKHGWEAASDAYKVTESDANRVIELDYKPALEVYKEVVQTLSKKTITEENFFDIAKAYPLGINKLSGEMVVRDPIMIEEDALICVGDVATNSFVSILHGSNESLVNATKEAKKDAHLEGKHFTLFIDCISRILFMGDSFHQELDAIYEEEVYFIGALTLGEIANNKKHYLEFYNKTAVVANIERLS